jgi:peroxiredoxin
MRAKPTLFFLSVGFLCSYFVYSEAMRKGQPGLVSVGEEAPDFSIKDEAGRMVKLSEFRGKVVFLNFWATWCAPCIDEAPEIELVNNAFKDRQFRILTISSDTDWSDVKNFHRAHKLTFPVFLDPGQQVSRYIYKITGWPETFLIDAHGVVVKHTFAAHWAAPEAVAQIEALIRSADETP